MTTTNKDDLKTFAEQQYTQALTESLARRSVAHGVPPSPPTVPPGVSPGTAPSPTAPNGYFVPGAVTPNAGHAPLNPVVRQLMEQKLAALPPESPQRQLLINLLANADRPTPLPAAHAQQIAQQNAELMEQVMAARREGDARSAAALEEAQNLARSVVELRAIVNTLMAQVAQHTEIVNALHDEMVGIVAHEVHEALEREFNSPSTSTVEQSNTKPAG